MNSSERRMLEELKCYRVIKNDIDSLRKRIESAEYRLTPSYSVEGGGFGGLPGSKVETLSIRRVDAEKELRHKEAIIRRIDTAIECSGLNKREFELINHIVSGDSLSSFAARNNIYKSHIYKIRDRALRKMVEYLPKSTE